MGTGLELGRHLWVHVDHHLLLLRHDGVPLLNLVLHPLPERLANDGSADVNDPLLGHLRQVCCIREVFVDVRMLADVPADALEREILVLWAPQSLNMAVLLVLLLAVQDIFEEVDGHVV